MQNTNTGRVKAFISVLIGFLGVAPFLLPLSRKKDPSRNGSIFIPFSLSVCSIRLFSRLIWCTRDHSIAYGAQETRDLTGNKFRPLARFEPSGIVKTVRRAERREHIVKWIIELQRGGVRIVLLQVTVEETKRETNKSEEQGNRGRALEWELSARMDR